MNLIGWFQTSIVQTFQQIFLIYRSGCFVNTIGNILHDLFLFLHFILYMFLNKCLFAVLFSDKIILVCLRNRENNRTFLGSFIF